MPKQVKVFAPDGQVAWRGEVHGVVCLDTLQRIKTPENYVVITSAFAGFIVVSDSRIDVTP